MTKRLLVSGLSGSGKSTYIAALNWALGEPPNRSQALQLGHRAGDVEYVDRLSAAWSRAAQLEKTAVGARHSVQFNVVEVDSARSVSVVVPDLSGETFDAVWRDRRWTVSFDDEVAEASAMLLFATARESYLPDSLAEEALIAQAVGVGEVAERRESQRWQPDHACPATKLADFVLSARERNPMLRVAVMVSAWDRVEPREQVPSEWLSENVPLLAATLGERPGASVVFGISAQGIELANCRADALAKHRQRPPQHRSYVVSPQGSVVQDLTAPVAWAISRD